MMDRSFLVQVKIIDSSFFSIKCRPQIDKLPINCSNYSIKGLNFIVFFFASENGNENVDEALKFTINRTLFQPIHG